MSDDLVAFYSARLDEDEAIANAAHGIWVDHDDGSIVDVSYAARLVVGPYGRRIDEASRTHILRHQPSRTLREIAAGRKLLAAYDEAVNGPSADLAVADALEAVIRDRAAVYAAQDAHPSASAK